MRERGDADARIADPTGMGGRVNDRDGDDDLWDKIDTDPHGPRYYDRAGEPMTLRQWAEARREDYQRVAQEDVLMPSGRTVWVSTVWLGLNHRFWGDGPPIIFETMVFENGAADEYMQRYCTEAEALQGHNFTVHALKEGLLTLEWDDE